MTPKERAAMQQALEALEVYEIKLNSRLCNEAITALREALAEQATVSGGLCGGCAKKAADGWALYCVECWEQAEQEPVPTGATHYQPHQKTYYKRVSATEWYLWSCTGKGWLPSKGTSDSSEWIMLSPIQAHQPAKPAEQEPTSKTKALDYAILTLHSIACLTQGDNLLWWQKSARNVLAKIDELLREQSVATYQEPASRAILCPPPPPEVYKMRSRDAFEAGWWEAQRQKAVSPISPVQQAEQEPVAWVPLTDDDRKAAFESLPDALEGFMKKWGWLHFAKEIERRCKEKNK